MITIGFGTEDTLKGRLIRWATDSPWSHAWIEYDSEVFGGGWVIHSWVDGVVLVPREQVYQKYPRRRLLQVVGGDVRNGLFWARGRISAPYDFGMIWNALLLVTYRAFGWEWLRKLAMRNASRYTCSEFVGAFLRAAGILPSSTDVELLTPGDVLELCEKSDDLRCL
jgi:hypothetical protein